MLCNPAIVLDRQVSRIPLQTITPIRYIQRRYIIKPSRLIMTASKTNSNGHSNVPLSKPKFGTLAVHAGSPHDPVTGAVIEPVRSSVVPFIYSKSDVVRFPYPRPTPNPHAECQSATMNIPVPPTRIEITSKPPLPPSSTPDTPLPFHPAQQRQQ